MTTAERFHGGFWPDVQQARLLRACLLKGEPALKAWQAWQAQADLNTVDHASQRMLPLLYRNLEALQVDHPWMDRLKGIYRYYWAKNQVFFHAVAAMIKDFHRAGIRTMVLKGAALALDYYQDVGLRPMDDFDLLVPVNSLNEGLRILREGGWQPVGRSWASLGAGDAAVRNAQNFLHPDGRNFDLHWHILYLASYTEADRPFWEAAVETWVQDAPVLALNPTDQIFHNIIHGVSGTAIGSIRWLLQGEDRRTLAPIRWIADTVVVLRASAEQIDWERLVWQSQRLRLTLPVFDALDYLRREMDVPVPAEAVQALERTPMTAFEHSIYRAWSRPHGIGGSLRALRALWYFYTQQTEMGRGHRLARQVLSFPFFVQSRWGIESAWQIPGAAIRKIRETLPLLARSRTD